MYVYFVSGIHFYLKLFKEDPKSKCLDSLSKGIWDSGTGGGVAQKVASGLGEAGWRQHWGGVTICWPGVPHSCWATEEENAWGQRGKSAQCPRWGTNIY